MKLEDLKSGAVVVADTGFTCIKPGEHIVQSNEKGDLFIACEDGQHLLDGQIGENGELIGLSNPSSQFIHVSFTKKDLECLTDSLGIVIDDADANAAIAEKWRNIFAEKLETFEGINNA